MYLKKMTLSISLMAGVLAAGPAVADDVDLKRFLSTSAGASGVAAAVAGLGQCDSELWWGIAYDPELDNDNPDHLFVACQYKDQDDGEMYDKSVVAKFLFLEGKPLNLQSLIYLP